MNVRLTIETDRDEMRPEEYTSFSLVLHGHEHLRRLLLVLDTSVITRLSLWGETISVMYVPSASEFDVFQGRETLVTETLGWDEAQKTLVIWASKME
jgi:hypothetical protein